MSSYVYYITKNRKTKKIETYKKRNNGILLTPGITGNLKGWKKIKKAKEREV
jgi:hypothetical protein